MGPANGNPNELKSEKYTSFVKNGNDAGGGNRINGTESGKPLLDFSRLRCICDGKMLLSDVSFTIYRGDFVSLLGPNGAGKSTLLKTILRQMPLTASSRITLEGEDLFRFPPRALARKIAYIPQSQAQVQSFSFTVRYFVETARYAYRSAWELPSSEDKKKCALALSETGLTNFASRDVSTLSGGELQRVWLAGAIAQDAEIFLLDEITSQMDYRSRVETGALLERLNREFGKTILSVTHDINEAAQHAGRILALKEGELVFDGKSAEFLNKQTLKDVYETDFTLLASPELPFPAAIPVPEPLPVLEKKV